MNVGVFKKIVNIKELQKLNIWLKTHLFFFSKISLPTIGYSKP
jgi:hypothetical protein